MKPIVEQPIKVKLDAKQTGATLITALVMLIVLTLLVISAMNSSNTNLRITGNMQIQEEAISAAQQATEQIISDNFTVNPAASTVNVSIGGTLYPVSVSQPSCANSVALRNNTPNLPPECVSSSSAQNTGIFFVSGVQQSGQSWCSAQHWEVGTTVTDTRTGATAVMHQGVSLDVPTGTNC